MIRKPLTLESIDKSLLYQKAASGWFLTIMFFFSVGVAIEKASTISLIIVMGSLFFLILIITNIDDEYEIITMYKKIRWYKNYARVTFFSGMMLSITFPFQSTLFIALLIATPILINGAIIWPLLTVKTYTKNYTKLFGLIDA